MKAEASVSTDSDDTDANPDDPEGMDSDLHNEDEHQANPEDSTYTYSFADVLSDYVSRFRFYLLLVLVLVVVGAWYFGLPRWVYFFGFPLVFSIAFTWRYVFDYISRLDSGIANLFLELDPDDGADHHGYEVGDGVIPDFDSDGIPAYPVQGVPDVYEVECLDVDNFEYVGAPRAALPYSDYVDVELRGKYHRREVVPLADEMPRLRARLHSQTVARTTEKTVENVELLEKALSGDLEPKEVPNPVLDGSDASEVEKHGARLDYEQNGTSKKNSEEVFSDD